ncbi:transcriptional regulator AhrC/ArgR [Gorillibacterium timonense]|uniref:transcriptional regulator AhrC/ArgR n=1 Tax=Gorillibacterium timonense TaxID=1689269 RepID=UPI00071D2CC7|nr:transcriptional regulator ArgR [Gorillibacterium timonense]
MKGKRHLKIKEILNSFEIETQEDLVDALREAGFNVTQATVSRDIKEMHLIKTPTADGRYKYAVPAEQRFNPEQRLKRALMDQFVGIDYTENLVVMKCTPGTANALGAILDVMDWEGMMGTICGDDTILVICRTKERSEEFVNEIMSLLG